MRILNTLLLASLIILLMASICPARLRMPYEDETVVQRSDLIVVAAIKEGSVRYIPHPAPAGEGHSWEHHVILKVSTVVRGEWKPNEIPVVIDYGLDPLTGAQPEHGPASQPVATTAPMKICDTGNSAWHFEPLVADALQDNVWLLRIDKDGVYHIRDPEELQPGAYKDYLACYLAKDPETAVRAQMQRQPAIAVSASRYLAHVEIGRIAKEPDLAVRAERLMPYVQAGYIWAGQFDAMAPLIECGSAAGPYLMAAYESTGDAQMREQIIHLWGQTHYTGAVDELIKLLDPQRTESSTLRASIGALGEIGTPPARRALEVTRHYWEGKNLEDPQVVQACDRALAELDRTHR